MGKLILCSGKRTERPYVMPSTGVRVYSIEELCYYIYNNIYFIDESLLSDSLIDWIRTELCLPDRADKLEASIEQGADYKTLLAVVLCSCDYYTEEEIKKIIKAVDQIRIMPLAKRLYIKANSYLKRKLYAQAAAEYERILKSHEASDLSPKDYGDVLHNLAIAKLYIYGPGKAGETFLNAYERNHRKESLRQYFYSLWLTNDRKAYEEKLIEYNIDEDESNEIALKMEQVASEASMSKKIDEINKLHRLRNTGKLEDFQKKCMETIEVWIDEIRKM